MSHALDELAGSRLTYAAACGGWTSWPLPWNMASY